MVIYVNHMVAQKTSTQLQLSSNCNLIHILHLILMHFNFLSVVFFAVFCLFRCSDGGLKMKFITREIQIKNGSRENAINFMSFFTLSFSVFLLVNNGGKKKKSENDNLTIYESVFFSTADG